MPTVLEHLTSIYGRLDALDAEIARLETLIAARASDPLDAEIDLDLPHASAGNAATQAGAAGGEATVETEVTEDSLTVSLPAASSERQAERRRFAEQVLQLNEVFPDLDADGGLSAVDAYAKGGPMWLYLGSKEGRDHILSLPVAWRAAMVDDVAEDSTQTAHEFGRDVLKDAEPTAGMGVSYDYLLSTVDA